MSSTVMDTSNDGSTSSTTAAPPPTSLDDDEDGCSMVVNSSTTSSLATEPSASSNDSGVLSDSTSIILRLDTTKDKGYEEHITFGQGKVSDLVFTVATSHARPKPTENGEPGHIVVPIGCDVNREVLQLIALRMRHTNGVVRDLVPKPLRSKYMKNVTNAWDADFIDRHVCKLDPTTNDGRDGVVPKKNLPLLYMLTLAANYLDIKDLLALCCAKVASIAKGKSLEEVGDVLSPFEKKKKDPAAEKTN